MRRRTRVSAGSRWRRKGLTILLAVGAPTAVGCADALLSPEPADSPTAVAHALWTEVDQYYAFFDLKGVDWDAVGQEYLPRVTDATSDDQLFETLVAMLRQLRDGHTTLDTPRRHWAWDGWVMDYPQNFEPAFIGTYLHAPRGSAAGGSVTWGRLGARLGYLRISTFGVSGVGEGVDSALASLGDSLQGLVVDVRSNGGGSDTQAEAAAGRFVGERVQYRTVRYKNGPAHDDFGPWKENWIEPAGPGPFTKPVSVLTNRGVYSAAEDFVLAMRELPQVVVVGDTTGGGSGNPIARELPNGWVVHVSRWQVRGPDGASFEGVGLAPDIPVQMTDADRAKARDTILNRGALSIYERLAPGG